MDPNEALKKLREFMARVGYQVECGEEVDEDDVAFIVETWEGLDGWLSKGGFTPKEWTDKQKGPQAILEAIVRYFNSAATLQRAEGRPQDAVGYATKAAAVKYAIEVLMGKVPVPEFKV